MKLILTNKSPIFSQSSSRKEVVLTWNARIGQVISDWNLSRWLFWWTHLENLKKYKNANITFQLSTKLQETYFIKISTNLVLSDIFNPTAEIFCINTQSQYNYVNVTFREDKLTLNDCYIDSVIFKIEPLTNSEQPFPNLDFKIGIELLEGWKIFFQQNSD